MTYSILAKCPETGRYGLGIATYSVAVGQWCDGLHRYAGATMSQAFVRTTNNALALNLLKLGHSASFVTAGLIRDDDFASYRQIGVISADGSASCYSGEHARGWAGHRIGNGYVAMGNVLSSGSVVEAMAEAFEGSAAQLFEERLMRALEAGRDAGGQGNGKRPLSERSGALIVTASDYLDAVNLRVDLHSHAVNELRRVYSVCSQYAAYYRSRGIFPPDAPGQEMFEQQNGISA